MHKSGFKGILFDLDGTLVDSLKVTFEAFNQGILSQGGKRHSPAEIMAYFGPGEKEIFAQIIGREGAQAAYDVSCKYMDDSMTSIPLHAGVGDLLEKIKSAGAPVSIFTGRSWNTTEIILRHHRILDRFITVIANDHVKAPKPAPDGILIAAERMKMEPAGLMYVGDSVVDIRSAKGGGAQAVAAAWDLIADHQGLRAHEPHHWAETPADVWEIFQSRL